MNKNINIVLLFSLLALGAVGCASLEVNAYRTTGSVVYAVDKAMSAWGDYVQGGHATANDEFIVRAAYSKYQKALKVERVVVLQYKDNKDKTALSNAISALSNAANEIIDLIVSFMPEIKGTIPAVK